MNVLEAIRTEVNKTVDAQHASIVLEFLERIDHPPCDCKFDKEKFLNCLDKYTTLKIQLQHWKQTHRDEIRWLGGYYRLPINFSLDELVRVRKTLSDLAPCKDCIAKINPTSRKFRSKKTQWNPQRARVWKELIK